MSLYPPAADPADNETLRTLHNSGIPYSTESCFVKENGITVSAWVMRNTEVNRARYNAIYDSVNPPETRMEALERAGATFYPHWYQCEGLRVWQHATAATRLALGEIEKTKDNIRRAELELQENAAGMDDDRIAEECKSLAWVQEEMQKRRRASDGEPPSRGQDDSGETDVKASLSAQEATPVTWTLSVL